MLEFSFGYFIFHVDDYYYLSYIVQLSERRAQVEDQNDQKYFHNLAHDQFFLLLITSYTE